MASKGIELAPYLIKSGEDSKTLHLFCKAIVGSLVDEMDAKHLWLELESQLMHLADFMDVNGSDNSGMASRR